MPDCLGQWHNEYWLFQHVWGQSKNYFMSIGNLKMLMECWCCMAYLGQGTFLAFVLGGGLDFNFAVEKVVDGHLRKCVVEWSSETWIINWDTHSIRTGNGSNGSIRCTHSDIHVTSNNFNFIVVLVIDDGFGFNGLVSVMGLDVYVLMCLQHGRCIWKTQNTPDPIKTKKSFGRCKCCKWVALKVWDGVFLKQDMRCRHDS